MRTWSAAVSALLVCMGAGCGSGPKCEKACEHIESCGPGITCPFSAECTVDESCQAKCVLAASCHALTGQDSAGAATYSSCMQQCSAVVGPSTGDVCERAFARMKSCAAALNCAVLTGEDKFGCELLQQILGQMSYSQAQAMCEQQTPGQCQCTGEVKQSAEQLLTCTLDPLTCSCPEDSTAP